jgi:CHAT domain-containing protein
VLDPALPHLRDKQHWIVCPDGQIALVPFECLPVEDDKYLVEVRKLSYLGAGREVVTYSRQAEKAEKAGPPVLVGAPDFDFRADLHQAELGKMGLAAGAMKVRGVGGSRELRQVLFAPLPATGPEVEGAAKLLGGNKLLGRQALEGAIKQVSAPEILYLATHGFFLPDQAQEDGGDLMAPLMSYLQESDRGGPPGLKAPDQRLWLESPLLRCGLALAGANRREAPRAGDIDDGILTGVEVSGLNLSGTRLVVLSACQTGLGDIRQGEGVMGLRRAFLLAGARRVLATLWMIPDRETNQVMSDFIVRWKAGTPAVDALREAQLAMISQLRHSHGHAHPFYWAAFTMTGDWR